MLSDAFLTDQSVIPCLHDFFPVFPDGSLMARPFASLLMSVVLLMFAGCQQKQKKPEPPPPPTVEFVNPIEDQVTEYEEFTGRTAATQMIEIRARVTGYLASVDFMDGDQVTRDEVLFRIDDRPFAAEEQRTAAAVSQIEARIQRLTSQLRRAEELLARKAMSPDEFETIGFDLAEAKAGLAEAVASHELARLNLQYTTVTAPLSGRIGRRLLDEGNLVTAEQTLLATIVPLEKVHVYFDMDERTVLKLRQLGHQVASASGTEKSIPVQIALADSEEYSLKGEVDFFDNQIDPATGTLRVRATVNNSDGLLSPGFFVRVKYPIGSPGLAMLIPEEAMASDQGRPFVYVVAGEAGQEIAEARPVTTGPLEGGNRVIRSGLTASDRVIVTGLQRLRGKDRITPKDRNAEQKAEKTDGQTSL